MRYREDNYALSVKRCSLFKKFNTVTFNIEGLIFWGKDVINNRSCRLLHKKHFHEYQDGHASALSLWSKWTAYYCQIKRTFHTDDNQMLETVPSFLTKEELQTWILCPCNRVLVYAAPTYVSSFFRSGVKRSIPLE